MKDQSIIDAVRRFQAGDAASFDEIYKKTFGRIRNGLYYILKDEGTAEDLAQETFIKIYTSISQLDDPEKFMSWANTIAVRNAQSYLRKASSHEIVFSDMATETEEADDRTFEESIVSENSDMQPEEALEKRETEQLLWEIVSSLPPGQRLVVTLHYYEGMKQREIAKATGLSETAVKQSVFQAKKKIEKKVRELEKKGVRLRSMAPFAFFLWLVTVETESAAVGAGVAAAGAAAAATAGSTLAASGAAAAASGTAAASAGGFAGWVAGASAATKALLAALAGTVVIGGAVTTAVVINENKAPAEGSVEESETIPETEDPGGFAPETIGESVQEERSIETETPTGEDIPTETGLETETERSEETENSSDVGTADGSEDPSEESGKETASTDPEREVMDSGDVSSSLGTNHVTWTLYEDGELVISGTGLMANFQSDGCGPWGRSVKNAVVESGVERIGQYAFNGCTELQSVTLPDSLGTSQGLFGGIGSGAFTGCTSLTSVALPNGLSLIDAGLFQNCTGLRQITIPDTVQTIDNSAFSGCASLTSVTLPKSLTRIGQGSFRSCSALQSIVLPDSALVVAERAFEKCSSLREITVMPSVKEIGRFAFQQCTSLVSVTVLGMDTSILQSAFFSDSSAVLSCYRGSKAAGAYSNLTTGLSNGIVYLDEE